MPFLFVFFWDTYDLNVEVLTIVSEVSKAVFFSFYPFLFFHFGSFISTIIYSNSIILSSASVTLLLDPSRMFLISVIAFITDYFLFILGPF